MQAVLPWTDQLEHGKERTHTNPEDWSFHTTGFFFKCTNQKNQFSIHEDSQRKGRKKKTFLPNIIPSWEVKCP